MAYNGYGVYTPNTYGNYNNGYPSYNPMPAIGLQGQGQMSNMGQMPQMAQTQPNQPIQQQPPAQAQPQPQMAQVPMRTNKILVTSYEEALSRPTEFNSEAMYFHQSEPFVFQIYTDMQGKKTPYIYKFTECSVEEMEQQIKGVKRADLTGFVTESDLNDCLSKFEDKIVQYIKQNVPPLVKPKKKEAAPKEPEIIESEE